MQSIPVNEFSSTEHEFRLEESFTVLLGKYNTSLSEVFSLLLPQSTSGNLRLETLATQARQFRNADFIIWIKNTNLITGN